MKFVISRYNHDLSWLKDYSGSQCVIYDRSDDGTLAPGAIQVLNIGSDIYDKFTFIIDNYSNLPDVAIYTKANLFKYITKEEFNKVKDNKVFTPLLTKNHKTYSDGKGPVCWYNEEGMYCERNDYWYLAARPAWHFREIVKIFEMDNRKYNKFAPGSNYILPKENILKYPKDLYEKLRNFLNWDVYPGDAQLLERNLYYLWNTPQSPKMN